jgi:hypothetical protein
MSSWTIRVDGYAMTVTCFETGSQSTAHWHWTYHVTQADPELVILLPLPPKCWDYRHAPSHLAHVSQFFIFSLKRQRQISAILKSTRANSLRFQGLRWVFCDHSCSMCTLAMASGLTCVVIPFFSKGSTCGKPSNFQPVCCLRILQIQHPSAISFCVCPLSSV